MLVIGLGGAAVSIVRGDLSLTISGMSLAAIVGIIPGCEVHPLNGTGAIKGPSVSINNICFSAVN